MLCGQLNAIADDEIDESRYFPTNNLPARTLPKHRERIAHARQHHSGAGLQQRAKIMGLRAIDHAQLIPAVAASRIDVE